jgi:hypothetical protein
MVGHLPNNLSLKSNHWRIIMSGLIKNAPEAPANTTNKAVAFLNWSLPTANGEIKARKGFPIYSNPKYPNPHEDMLVALAKKHGGKVALTMNVMVSINNGGAFDTIDLDSIIVNPIEEPAA